MKGGGCIASIIDIEGIGEKQAEILRDAGVQTVEGLLEAAGSASGRKVLSSQTGLSEVKLLKWVSCADLYRISGIGSEFSDLLKVAGVDSVPELSQRNPENLHQALEELNTAKHIVRQLPSVEKLTDFINQAKKLPKVVTH